MRFSRRRIGAFARVVGNTEAEYFDPIISSYDGFRDVIAPAVFAVVPGQQQLNELLNEVAPGTLPLLHGIHLEIDQPIVAGTPITIATRPMQQRISGDIGTLNTETIISDDDGKLLATLTQKLALISGRAVPQINVSPEPAALETEPKQGSDSFQFELTQQDLADYVTVSDDANPIHTSPEYAQEFGYHAPLAQGMLMLGRVISHLESTLNHYSIPKQIQARFIAPVIVPPAGATIIVHTTKTDKRYEMALTQNDRRIVRASITLN